ncbi:MAG: hypothetical protein M3254_09255 [Actinomycetota bacterium]|nr:hypothetical protein [Actinomycetota bacterium]
MMLNPEDLNKMIRAIMETREEDIGCDECFEQLDLFVETKLSGLNAAAAMPLVQDHLDKCGDCREEFEALLTALRATEYPSFGAVRRLWRRIRGVTGP